MRLGRSAVPAEEVELAAVDSARYRRRNFEAFFPADLLTLRQFDDARTVGIGTLADQ